MSDPAILTVEYYAGRWTMTEIAGVGEVYSIAVQGQRHVLKTPSERFRIRGQEIKLLVEGKRDDWSAPYFDPASPKRYDRQPDYETPMDHEHEAKRNRPKGTRATPSKTQTEVQPAAGCAPVLAVGMVAVWATGQAFGFF